MSKRYPQQTINSHLSAGIDCGFAYRGHHFLNPDFSPSPFFVGDVQSYPKLDISEKAFLQSDWKKFKKPS